MTFQVTKRVRKYSFIRYILSDTSANICKSVDDIINYSTSICPFESGNCEEEGKKL